MIARYKGTCKRTNQCTIKAGEKVYSYNGGWAHVVCPSKLKVKPAGVKPVGNITVCSCGGDIADVDSDGGYCLSCGKYYASR